MITPADLEDYTTDKLRALINEAIGKLNRKRTVRRGRNQHRSNVKRREELESLLAACRIELDRRGTPE